MSRIYWDSVLFLYLLEKHPTYASRVRHLLQRSLERGDVLFTSYLALGEVLAGASKAAAADKRGIVRTAIDRMGFSYLPFGEQSVGTFIDLRANRKLKAADSIHLACAAAAGIDMFLTGDRQLVGMYVPGIKFIADFETSVF